MEETTKQYLDSCLNNDNNNLLSEPLKAFKIEGIDDYLTEEAKLIIHNPLKEDFYNPSLRKETGLYPAYVEIIVEDEISEKEKKKFANIINDLVSNGIIERGAMCPILGLKLQIFTKKRYLIFLFTASKYDLQEQKQKSKYLFAEGELPTEYKIKEFVNEIKDGSEVRYIGGQENDEVGKQLFELQPDTKYHVFQRTKGNFTDGQKDAIYLKEAGLKCAFLMSMFELWD